MTKYKIPNDHIAGFKLLADLSKENFDKLFNILKGSRIGMFPDALVQEIAPNVKIKLDELNLLTDVIYAVCAIKSKEDKSNLQISTDILSSLKENHPNFKMTSAASKILKERVLQVLSLDGSIGLTVKTLTFGDEYENVYLNSRIFSDIRPAFSNLNDKINTGIISHNLKIQFVKSNSQEQVFITLTSKGLQELKEQIIRAEKKEELIVNSLKGKIEFITTNKD